jgi:hypothetical protein
MMNSIHSRFGTGHEFVQLPQVAREGVVALPPLLAVSQHAPLGVATRPNRAGLVKEVEVVEGVVVLGTLGFSERIEAKRRSRRS